MSDQTKTIGIHIGAMCDSIAKQLKSQGVPIFADDVAHFQRAVEGFIQLRILGCFGDKEADRIAQRLAGKILKYANDVIQKQQP